MHRNDVQTKKKTGEARRRRSTTTAKQTATPTRAVSKCREALCHRSRISSLPSRGCTPPTTRTTSQSLSKSAQPNLRCWRGKKYEFSKRPSQGPLNDDCSLFSGPIFTFRRDWSSFLSLSRWTVHVPAIMHTSNTVYHKYIDKQKVYTTYYFQYKYSYGPSQPRNRRGSNGIYSFGKWAYVRKDEGFQKFQERS